MLVRLRCCRSVAWRKVEQASLPVGKILSHRTPGLDAVGDPVRPFQISSSNRLPLRNRIKRGLKLRRSMSRSSSSSCSSSSSPNQPHDLSHPLRLPAVGLCRLNEKDPHHPQYQHAERLYPVRPRLRRLLKQRLVILSQRTLAHGGSLGVDAALSREQGVPSAA